MSLTESRAALLATLAEVAETRSWDLSRGLARTGVLALCLASLVIQGGIFQQKTWFWTGDTIYHHALMAEIQAGELLPGGPYPGMPAFYSPLFHWIVAAVGLIAGMELTDAIRLVSIAFAPLLPLVCYWAARSLRFDRSSALVGAVLGSFAGGWKIAEDRVWVDSLFVGQHNFLPLFPRDIAFLLLPLGLVLVYRAVVQAWWTGGLLAGAVFALMVLAHTQTAVFAAPVLAVYLALLVLIRPDLFGNATRVSVLTIAVTVALPSFWWVGQLEAIRQGGSFSVEMPAARVPVKLELAEFPLEFGVFLVLGPLGVIMTARQFIRDRDPAALLLLVWWLAPALLAVVRPSGFPGGDTFFPRRLWQFASQPLAFMAAAALVSGVVRTLRLRGVLAFVLVGATCLVAVIPASRGTWERIGEFWNTPEFVDQEWSLTGNFAFGPWLAREARAHGPRTVLAPITESTLIWYEAGQKVVYLHRTAAIKLAFDVERLSGVSEADRRADSLNAYRGDPGELARIADKHKARYIVLKRSGDRLAGVDLVARGFLDRGEAGRGQGRLVSTNHYEYLALAAGDRASFQIWSPDERDAELVFRAKRRGRGGASLGTLTVNGSGTSMTESELPRDDWSDVRRQARLRPGPNDVQIESAAQLEALRLTAYTLATGDLPPGWRVAYQDAHYAVLSDE